MIIPSEMESRLSKTNFTKKGDEIMCDCVRCGKPISAEEADDNGSRCENCAADEAQPESYSAVEEYALSASAVRMVDYRLIN
jgi:hypothetical protein